MMAGELKTDWNIAIEVLAENHFRQGRDMNERRQIAERHLNDVLHYQTAHLGKPVEQTKRDMARAYSDPDNLSRALRRYTGPNL
jgi:hypothetical protein